jgi:hypothetical protein
MAKNTKVIDRDPHDGGVPMLPATNPRDEPAGPEDALGLGPKRGDYTDRLGGSSYNPHTVVAVEHVDDEGGVEVEQVSVPQKELAANIGDEPGLKGGVDTHTDQLAAENFSTRSSSGSGSGKGSGSGSGSGSSS